MATEPADSPGSVGLNGGQLERGKRAREAIVVSMNVLCSRKGERGESEGIGNGRGEMKKVEG
jgi:hypothetical protein